MQCVAQLWVDYADHGSFLGVLVRDYIPPQFTMKNAFKSGTTWSISGVRFVTCTPYETMWLGFVDFLYLCFFLIFSLVVYV